MIKTIPAYPQQAEKGSTIIMVISVGTEPLPEEPVPDVVRAGVEDAITKISQAGFYVNRDNIVRQNHPSYPEGTVISQEPNGDSKLKKGSEVKLVISSGYKDVSVNVSLAGISTSVDLKVFIPGVEDKSLTSVTFTAKEQKGLYQANVMISESGKNDFKPFATYEINGLDGRATLTEFTSFVSTATTPPVTSDPTTQTPTSSEPTSDSGPTDPTDNSSTSSTDEVSTFGNE